jgi:sugar lactone lactonase YvrE
LFGNTTDAFGATGGDALYSIDPVTGAATLIGRIGFSNVFALGFDNSGALFGVSDASDELIGISTASGLGALVGPTGLSNSFDIAARPEDGVMFLADSGTSSLYTIDTATGATKLVGPYGSTTNVVGLAFSPVVPEPTTLVLVGGGLLLLGLRRSRSRMA